ncbi:MAG TPA: hypothetical protein VF011_00260 [Terriglobales bacterium]
MKILNSRADQKRADFEALAAFANLGEKPEDWRKFRLMWPNFFPTDGKGFHNPGFRNLSEWLYHAAEDWAQNDDFVKEVTITPLLWYRDRVRAVWARNDPRGKNLEVLYGFEDPISVAAVQEGRALVRPLVIPGQPTNPDEQDTYAGLPRGRAIVDGIKGTIEWKFGCGLQQSVYELMQERWHTRICPACGRYFLADKSAQSTCSTKCSGTMRRRSKLEYWNNTGSKKRAKKNKEGKKR